VILLSWGSGFVGKIIPFSVKNINSSYLAFGVLEWRQSGDKMSHS